MVKIQDGIIFYLAGIGEEKHKDIQDEADLFFIIHDPVEVAENGGNMDLNIFSFDYLQAVIGLYYFVFAGALFASGFYLLIHFVVETFLGRR